MGEECVSRMKGLGKTGLISYKVDWYRKVKAKAEPIKKEKEGKEERH